MVRLRSRGQRKLGARPRTLKTRESAAQVKREAEPLFDWIVRDELAARPRYRGDCIDGPRPCPWVGCRYNLFVDVKPGGYLRMNFPDRDLEDLVESCALDVAEEGEHTREAVGDLINLTGPQVGVIESEPIARLREGLSDFRPEDGEDE